VDTTLEPTASAYTVKTTAFEGPLELLLSLVEAKKLFINEISLASVTNEYLAFARGLPKGDLSELTSFLSVAATLILIKSRSLLPGFLVTKEEEKDIVDLESRLALYAMMRDISVELSARYGTTIIRLPVDRETVSTVFAPDPKLSIDILRGAALDCLGRVPKEEALPEVRVRKIISIEEMLDSLTERIAQATTMSFRQWQGSVVGADREAVRSNVIVSFLAMLELVRQGMMDALQETDFEDIALSAISAEDKQAHHDSGIEPSTI
jgi:segregation and condensation protein A